MVRCSVTPTKITSKMTQGDGAVVMENEIVSQEIGEFSVPRIYEIKESGTELDLGSTDETLYYDGAAILYYGAGGYLREDGSKNVCYSLQAVYDIAVTLDIDYE